MAVRITLQPAFVLHTRPYSDTSLLVDLFTLNHGRISAIARGARTVRSRFRGLLRPFVPLLASWSSRTELMNLSNAESNGMSYIISGRNLLSGIYLNELLVRLLHRHDAHPDLFMAYQQALVGLQENKYVQRYLRLFELQLIAELGYGLQLDREAITNKKIQVENWYSFDPVIGFVRCDEHNQTALMFSGKSLLSLQQGKLVDKEDLRAAKQLMRMAIAYLIQDKPIKSFELFRHPKPKGS